MPATLTLPPPIQQVALVPYRFSVDQYDRMIEAGIITEDDRVELIRGEIVQKMGINGPHITCVNKLTALFCRVCGLRAVVSIQNPVILADSEPEPDVSVLKPRPDFYGGTKPGAADVLLVIEVADSSIAQDRGIKLKLYAEAKIAEFWIANLVDECLEVYRKPRSNGSYASVQRFNRDESISPLAFPDLKLSIAEML